MQTQTTYILDLRDLTLADLPIAGGKNASLGELLNSLSSCGVRVPEGFAVLVDGYRDLLATDRLGERIGSKLNEYRTGARSLAKTGRSIRNLILDTELPPRLALEIAYRYAELSGPNGHARVAVRSSATAEDLPDASFAGQQDTFLNVSGVEAVQRACLRAYASLFTDRAIAYREQKGFDHMEVSLSIGIQRMVRSDLGSSGVMFTIDPETGFDKTIVINSAWGLGEAVVQGAVTPDEFCVFKPGLEDPRLTPILRRITGEKSCKVVFSEGLDEFIETVPTTAAESRMLSLSDSDVIQLARWGAAIEQAYGRPMDIEWARDGEDGKIYIVQARPETVKSQEDGPATQRYRVVRHGDTIVTGISVGEAAATGRVCRIDSPADIEQFIPGSVLVTRNTDPDWVPIMTQAAAIVTDVGGRTSHAAIVSRELGKPAVVGTGNGTQLIADGEEVTVSCASGSTGHIYRGAAEIEVTRDNHGALPETHTQIMLNVAVPDGALKWHRLKADGIGLARLEFIFGGHVKAHPLALLHPDRVSDPREAAQLRELTRDFDDPRDYMVDRLTSGIAMIAASTYPHPAIVRFSDFKSNEYADLPGGRDFEPLEENPMLGYRGASRYYSTEYRPAFELECRAIKTVRDIIGLDNVIPMVPFCRTPEEADRVLGIMAESGLRRGENGLEVYVMAELPSNVILADEFARRFDGFSIGSNDLTQLILGVDRDSTRIADLFDERNPAVMSAIRSLISKAHAAGIKVGICGQGPSDYPEFAEFLVSEGIDSISLNPDSFVATKRRIARLEARTALAAAD